MTEQQKRRLNDMLEARRQRELEPDAPADVASLAALIADDSYAMTFQSMGQYRTALLKAARAIETEALRAAPASRAQAAPTGYKLLPIESTGLMDTAGMMALRNLLGDTAMRDDAEACYRAMIEAAPAAPAVIDQPTAAEIRAQALEEAAKVADEHYYGPCGEYDYSYSDASAKADDRAEQIAAAIRALASKEAAPAEVPSQWISVEDRLPDDEEPVLAYGAKRTEWAVMQRIAGDWNIETASDFHSSYAPKYWMPLPAAPVQSRTQGESGGEDA